MAEPTPTAAHLAFLADVRDRLVLTHEDMHVYLEIPGDPPALVSTIASLLEHHGWIREPADNIDGRFLCLGGCTEVRGAAARKAALT